MKMVHGVIGIIALAFTLPAQAATGDPEVVLYRASGVIDDNQGIVTAITCTPFSGVSENIRVVVRASNGAQLANSVLTVPHLNTAAWATRDTQLFTETNLATGVINPGTLAIAATSTSVSCTVILTQFQTANPIMVPLHLIRFNPLAGTAE